MLFSIIIPMYNAEKYIRQCLDSVLAQDYSDYEIIVVDDGSTDCSAQIVDEYARKQDCMKVIHKTNGGQSTARNAGLKYAAGEYVLFLDSDDFYMIRNAFSLIALKCKNEPDIIAFKYEKYYERNSKYEACSYSFADIDISMSYINILMALIRKDAFFCSAWSKAVKRSILMDYHICFDELSRCEDMDWYYNVISAIHSIDVIDEVMIGYRQSEASVTATKTVKTIDQFILFFDHWIPIIDCMQDTMLALVLTNASAKLYVNLIVSYVGVEGMPRDAQYERIKKYSFLLNYRENPRVKKIWILYRIVGIKILTVLLRFALKMKMRQYI